MFESMARATARRQPQVSRESIPPPSAVTSSCGRPAALAAVSSTDVVTESSVPRCDVCNGELDPKHGEEQGTGIYVWVRGGEVRREIVPLCPMCSGTVFAAAVGVLDWDDEE